jgi:hypothetical protein
MASVVTCWTDAWGARASWPSVRSLDWKRPLPSIRRMRQAFDIALVCRSLPPPSGPDCPCSFSPSAVGSDLGGCCRGRYRASRLADKLILLAFAISKRVDGIRSDGSRPPWERMTSQLFHLTMERPRSPFTFRSGIGPIAHVLDAARLGVQVCSRKREHPSRASCRYHIFACLRGATASQSPERDTPASLDVHHHRAGVDAMMGSLYRPRGQGHCMQAFGASAALQASQRKFRFEPERLVGLGREMLQWKR